MPQIMLPRPFFTQNSHEMLVINSKLLLSEDKKNPSISPFPTNPFTILELSNPSHDVPELQTTRRSTDFGALELVKCSSGYG